MKKFLTFLGLLAAAITVNAQNFCQASWTVTIDPSTFIAAFTDSSVSQSGNIISWLWDFGDGTTASGQQVTHQYNQIATNYIVCLTITTDSNCTS
ncbi:MAG: PKD domain-containing protein, partial [Bacteroidia bacterium]|nr:PKD domain-containing protein [Bacteroidia bacterium]